MLCGIPVNFAQYRKGFLMNTKGCIFLEEGINFDLTTVCDCCISHNDGRGLPVLINNYHGEMIDWNNLFDKKAERIAAQKQKTIYDCEGCYHLCDYKFTETRKISEFHFSHSRACNAKCIYCSDQYSAGTTNYNVYPVIKDLIEKGFYKPGGEATLQGGEPTLMQNFDELVDLFIENGTTIRVHTSAIKYSPTVEKALKINKGSVVISLDSGCSETYAKIKQVNAFDKVCNCISRYAEAAKEYPDNVIIKYIIIPGINDTTNEIDKFFKIMQKYNIKTIAVDLEVQYARKYDNKDISPHIYLLYDYFEEKAKENKIRLITYSFFSYALNNRKIKKFPLINNKFLFDLFLKMCNKKEKNIIYRR